MAALMLALSPSCKSTADDVPCTCGTPMADLEGCAHKSCMEGRNNPDNPDCVCGKIEIPQKKED